MSTDDTLPDDGKTTRAPKLSLPNYTLGGVIGRGGMGEVFEAHDLRMEREVAVKRLRTGEPTADALARFVREAKIQARLDHPAIVPVYEMGTDEEGRPYFTMKRLVGTTLAEHLAAHEPIKPLLNAFVTVCYAIERAHERDVVHRDLKPSNIMLGKLGEVYVIDWGVARVLTTERTSAIHLPIESLQGTDTATGMMLGTPGYMAPEQMRGEDVGPAADVWSLGSILFEIVAGEPLLPAGHGAIATTLAGVDASPAKRAPARPIAPELDALCVAALAEDPAARPSAAEVAARVRAYLDGDRDLEQRRALAAKELAAARLAIDSNDPSRRAEAVHAAGRALALHPDSTEAASLVASLILQPPVEMPEELADSLARDARRLDRERSRRAIIPLLALFLWLPVLVFVGVSNWLELSAVIVVTIALAIIAWVDVRFGRSHPAVLLLGNLGLAIVFTRLAGTLVIAPTLIAGLIVALSGRSWARGRTWLIILWAVVAISAPLVLEAIGALAPTWEMTEHGLLVWGTIITRHGAGSALPLLSGQIALMFVMAYYTMTISEGRNEAQRRLQIQAWHLKQLLPRAAGKLSGTQRSLP